MKVEYICHACLLIETPDVRIVTDPWLAEPAYAGQWHVFPKPVRPERAELAQAILFSHGHEDHLHPPSLERMPKDVPVLFPYNWYGSIKEYLEELGFKNVREAPTGKRFQLGPDTFVTYVANNLDSIIVIEAGGQVLVNVNDALHAHHPRVIEMFTERLRARWPKIDVVFCGFGGASYFPNTLHVEGKDDEQVGRLREQFFVHNFCRIVAGLKPSVAVPFAADFALLEATNDWMNRIRFPRSRIDEYFREHFGGECPETKIIDMYSGDVLDGVTLHASSPYRKRLVDGDLQHLIAEQYGPETEAANHVAPISEQSAAELVGEIEANLKRRAPLFKPETLAGLKFRVRATDVVEDACYHIEFVDGAPRVTRSNGPAAGELLEIALSSRILRYSFDSTWGGDAIVIGYGCSITVFDKKALARKLDTVCVRLLTRHPVASRHMAKQPWRAARFLMGNPLTRSWAIRRLLRRDKLDATYDADLWLTRTKCEVCQTCNMPLLDARFSSQL